MSNLNVVILAGPDSSYLSMYHAIESSCVIRVVVREKENRSIRILKNRVKRLGLVRTLGQVMFKVIALPILKLTSRKRRVELMQDQSNLSLKAPVLSVKSVNAVDYRDLKSKYPADLFILSGTRILSKRAIAAIEAPIWNIHTGITPAYRGVHGGYWALYNSDVASFGVTLHNVDSGIDTGKIISQRRVEFSSEDNFLTYPLLQLKSGYDLLRESLRTFPNISEVTVKGESRLWSHPSLLCYLRGRIRGVK